VLWLLRHGDAAKGSPDSERPLTDKGRAQAAAAGEALKALGVELDACLTSPKVRAADTATLACEPLGVEPREEPALAGGAFDALTLVAGLGDDVMLVGHDPDFSEAVRALTGARVSMKKGGLAGIADTHGGTGGELTVLLRPAELKRISS
jgi:phosphohistidine phosphatase